MAAKRRAARTKPAPAKPVNLFKPHPWHGLELGPGPPDIVYGFIEMTPFDVLKCEVDKQSGYTKVDRPLPSSSLPPAAYGFIPRTYCGKRIAKLAPGARRGDGDPLDICVVSEREINRVEVLLPSRVLGGFQMIDRGDADDKIVAVLANDHIWGHCRELKDLPRILVDRLEHYFLSYKQIFGSHGKVKIARIYGRAHARRVIKAAAADYQESFGHLTQP